MTADDIDDTVAEAIREAATAIEEGELVVYPTETVYGLGADALSTEAVERAFEAKGRSRDKPLSLAVPNVDAALDYTRPTDREVQFMREFLPGPVTVVVERRSSVPDALTAGRDRVGIRVPDQSIALALLDEVAPITATSANRSGAGSVLAVDDLDPAFREEIAVVVDGGDAPGTESTVVDVGAGVIHRPGANADTIETWLAEH